MTDKAIYGFILTYRLQTLNRERTMSKILIVDDEMKIREVLKEYAEFEGL